MNKNAKLKLRRQANRNIRNSLTLIYGTSTESTTAISNLHQPNNFDLNLEVEDTEQQINLVSYYSSESEAVTSSDSASETESETNNDEKFKTRLFNGPLTTMLTMQQQETC